MIGLAGTFQAAGCSSAWLERTVRDREVEGSNPFTPRFFLFFVFFFALLAATSAVAQPHVTVTAEARDNFRAVIFTFIQDDLPSMEGCHYHLFGADKAKDLETLPGGGLSLATFYRALPEVQIIAGPLPHLSRLQGIKSPKVRSSAKLYFRTLLSCPDAVDGLGEIFSLTFPTFTQGKLQSVNRLAKKMKFHMRYYGDASRFPGR